MTTVETNTLVRRLVPPVAAVLAISLFVSLGMWQLDRAAEKEALQALFESGGGYSDVQDVEAPEAFERLKTRGSYLADRQILIDNIVRNGRLGYFVITPVEIARGQPLLLVNRGFVDRAGFDNGSLAIDAERIEIQGLAGNLPRVGIRGGAGFEASGNEWPRVAVYPTLDEVAAELGAELLPFILLLGPEEPSGFGRDWQPVQSGPMTHYGYAFQWFAMAVAVVVIAVWQLRKQRKNP